MSLLVGLFAAAVAQAAVVDRVAAVVNDDVVTLSEVYELGGDYIEQASAAAAESAPTRREMELEVLDTLIMRRLISQEIERLGLDISDLEVDRAIEDVAMRNGLDTEALRREVVKTGMAWPDYRAEIRESLRQMRFSQAVIQPRIKVDEDQMKDAWRRTYASDDRPRRYDLGMIFIPFPQGPATPDELRDQTRAVAVDAVGRIRGGASFEEVAKELDKGPYAEKGGRYGLMRAEELRGSLGPVLLRLEPGQVSEPHEDNLGLWILTNYGEVMEEPPPLEEVREDLMETVYAGRIEEETDQWYRQARRRAAVDVKLRTPTGP